MPGRQYVIDKQKFFAPKMRSVPDKETTRSRQRRLRNFPAGRPEDRPLAITPSQVTGRASSVKNREIAVPETSASREALPAPSRTARISRTSARRRLPGRTAKKKRIPAENRTISNGGRSHQPQRIPAAKEAAAAARGALMEINRRGRVPRFSRGLSASSP